MAEKADSELVRRQNRLLVLGALRQHGASARVDLGRLTGLSPASITTICAQLISEGIISEESLPVVTPPSGKRGRPTVRLALNPGAALVLAVKISIDDVMIVLTDFRGETMARTEVRLPTYDAGRDRFGAALADEIAAFLATQEIASRRISRIGVAIQGLADSRSGSIVWSPAFKEGDIPVAHALEERFAVPCFVANDANMIAEGLVSADRVRYGGVTAAIFTGYGVGMGVIINGEVFHGATGAAAEFGHMNHIPDGALCRCGRKGCVEAYVADYGILRHYMGETEKEAPRSAVSEATMIGLHQKAKAGDAKARAAFELAGSALGYGIGRVISILNPDRIVLAGPGLQTSELMEQAMREALEKSVVEVLRRDVALEQVRFSDDMIIRGTVDALLRIIDRDVFAIATPQAASLLAAQAG